VHTGVSNPSSLSRGIIPKLAFLPAGREPALSDPERKRGGVEWGSPAQLLCKGGPFDVRLRAGSSLRLAALAPGSLRLPLAKARVYRPRVYRKAAALRITPESECSIYNHPVMKKLTPFLIFAACSLTACNKPAGSAAPSTGASAAPASPDAVQQKLQEYSGAGATDCGRLDVHAAEAQLKNASDCALQANQSKHPFYVAYDMPGMTVGVAGSAEGKLFTVQSQSEGASPSLTGGACPAQLRIASSGRVTCFAPGDMGSMSGSHGGGVMPPGMPNPHTAGGTKSTNQ